MTLAIEALLRGPHDEESVRRFLSAHPFPIVEGGNVTVVYVGEADGVFVRHWVYGLEASTALTRLAGTALWYLTMEIPPGSRIEYKLEVHAHGRSAWIQDPLNPNHAQDPFGANSVIQGAGYEPPFWTRHDPLAREGRLEGFSIRSRAFDTERGGQIYLPARFRSSRRYPLLVVHDGHDYLRYADLKIVLDNLIHRLEIPELVAVLSDSPDRLREYANDERHARYLSEELLPEMSARYPLIEDASARALMGASFGAVAAFSTALRFPGLWGRLLLQSGSFAFTDIGRGNRRGPLFDPIVAFVNAYRENPRAVAQRAFVSCGVYESLIYENRSLAPLLEKTGMQVRYEEARDGHNWDNWRDRLRTGLSWLLPGPLMLIYE